MRKRCHRDVSDATSLFQRAGGRCLIGLLLLAVLTVACQPTPTPTLILEIITTSTPTEIPPSPTPAPVTPLSEMGEGEQVTITFAPTLEDVTLYRPLAVAFNSQQSLIRVKLVDPFERKEADCFADFSRRAQEREVLDLQPFIEGDSDLDLAQFDIVDPFRERGALYALPIYADALALFYNVDMFDAAGLTYPNADWSLDDFLNAAKTLTSGRGDLRRYGYVPLGRDGSALPIFVELQGESLWNAEGEPSFGAPDAVSAVVWYTDLALKHEVMPITEELPNAPRSGARKREALVEEGRAAMWTGMLQTTEAPPGVTMGLAPLPGNRVKFYPVGLFIAADAPHPDACWRWLSYAVSHAPFSPALGVPAYRPALTSEALVGQAAPETVNVYQALRAATPIPHPPRTAKQQRLLLTALVMIYGGYDPDDVLSGAEAQARRE